MLLEFEKNIADFIKANGLYGPANKVLLAVSGGADSTALMYSMQTLRVEGILSGDIICAHINHRLRGAEADLDEDFVIAQAHNLKLAITTRQVDVRGFARKNKLSIETAARELRIESLQDIAKANNCNRIITAHQKNDNAETILQRLARGTGFRGLAGIWPVRSFADDIQFIRPLLCVRRDEIISYLKERGLKWQEDRMNEDCRYRRNYIRHRLLPALQQQCSGCIVEQLSELAQSARKFYSLVCNRVEKIWAELADCRGDKVVLDLQMFQPEYPAVKVELVRRSLATIGSGERDLTQEHFENILQLAQQNVSGRKIELPDGFVVWREYGKLVFARTETLKPDEQINKSIKAKVPGQTRLGNYLVEAAVFEVEMGSEGKFKAGKTSFVEWFDLDKLKLPLVVRSRQPGERFIPLGSTEEKKVGKFLTAQRVPQRIRKKTLVVCDSKKTIWVWPIRISEQAKITGETRKILRLQITDAKQGQIKE
jgi:tRNA(Ile)-lysidine synthase